MGCWSRKRAARNGVGGAHEDGGYEMAQEVNVLRLGLGHLVVGEENMEPTFAMLFSYAYSICVTCAFLMYMYICIFN